MARPQVQLPGILPSQAQAEPRSQFVQPKLNLPIPQEILDLSKFSSSLTNWIAQTQQDAHERAMAQGEADATMARPFGAGVAMTPQEEANRKAFQAAGERGDILPSEDPWYKIGVLTAEGRRAGLTVRDQILNDKTLEEMSRVTDENGNLKLDMPDIESEFNRRMQPFLNVPALQTKYGQRGALDIINATRAQFHEAVAKRRDTELQRYYTGEAIDQITKQLTNVEQMKLVDEGHARKALKGLDSVTRDLLKNANVPDPRKVLHLAYTNYYEKAAEAGPDRAVEAIDLVRKLMVGGATVESDNSVEGSAFRAQLEQDEEKYNSRAYEHLQREEAKIRLQRTKALDEADKSLSTIFAQADREGRSMASAYDEAIKWTKQGPPEYQDEARARADALYKAYVSPTPDDPSAARELDTLLLTKSPDDARAQVETWLSTGRVSATQRLDLRKQIQTQEEGWKGRDDVQAAQSRLKAQFDAMSQGRSDEAKKKFEVKAADELAAMNEQIQQLARSTPIGGEEKLALGIKEAIKNTQAKIAALNAEQEARLKEFNLTRQTENGKGNSVQEKILQAESDGLLSVQDADRYLAMDAQASDGSKYLVSDMVQNAARRVLGETEYNERPYAEQADLNARARDATLKWISEERPKYTSDKTANEAFIRWAEGPLRDDIASAAGKGVAERSTAATAGGPKISESKMQADGLLLQKTINTVPEDKKTDAIKQEFRKTALAANGKPIEINSVSRFVDSIGKGLKATGEARKEARDELSVLQATSSVSRRHRAFQNIGSLDVQVQDPKEAQAIKRALLSTGAARPSELLDGKMTLEDINGNPVDVPIAPEDINPWMPMFESSVQFDNYLNTSPEVLRHLSEKYHVPPSEFEKWKGQQASLLKAMNL